jgi:hypothetical protein
MSKSPYLNVFGVSGHNVVKIKLEQIQHFHFSCVKFCKPKIWENLPAFQNHNIGRMKNFNKP